MKNEGNLTFFNSKEYLEIKKLICDNKLIFNKNKYRENKGYKLRENIKFNNILQKVSSLFEERNMDFIIDMIEYIENIINTQNKDKQLYLLSLVVFYLRYVQVTKNILLKIKNIKKIFFNLFEININIEKEEPIIKDFINFVFISYKDITSLTGKQSRMIVDNKIFLFLLKLFYKNAKNNNIIYQYNKKIISSFFDIKLSEMTNDKKILNLITLIKESEKDYNSFLINKKELLRIKNYNIKKTEIISNIKNKFIGKEYIIENIFKSLNKGIYKINNRPISLLFTGESGTGKTEIGKEIARIFGGEPIVFNLGNFFSDHTLSTLLGAPPGYTGFSEETVIEKYINEINRKIKNEENELPIIPVLIFDELEKATPIIQNIFLELFDFGTLSLLNGTIVNLKNAIIILTSNIGVEKEEKIGFKQEENICITTSEDIKYKIKKYLRIEVVNRIDNFFYFNKNTEEELEKIKLMKIEQIVKNILNNFFFKSLFSKSISEKGIIKKITKKITDSKYDTNNIRILEKEIENIIIQLFF